MFNLLYEPFLFIWGLELTLTLDIYFANQSTNFIIIAKYLIQDGGCKENQHAVKWTNQIALFSRPTPPFRHNIVTVGS